jgi:hypothetical protein
MEGLEEVEDLALIESLGGFRVLKLREYLIKLEGGIRDFVVGFWLFKNAREEAAEAVEAAEAAEAARWVRVGMAVAVAVVILRIAKLDRIVL